MGPGGGNFSAKDLQFAGNEQGVAAGDLDRDGNLDVVIASDDTVQILRNSNGGQFGTENTLPGLDSVAGVALGDFNGDGWLDILISRGNGDPHLLFRNTNGQFSLLDNSTIPSSVGAGSYGIAVGDLNGDGYPLPAFPQHERVVRRPAGRSCLS